MYSVVDDIYMTFVITRETNPNIYYTVASFAMHDIKKKKTLPRIKVRSKRKREEKELWSTEKGKNQCGFDFVLQYFVFYLCMNSYYTIIIRRIALVLIYIHIYI